MSDYHGRAIRVLARLLMDWQGRRLLGGREEIHIGGEVAELRECVDALEARKAQHAALVEVAGKYQALHAYYGADHALTMAAFGEMSRQLLACGWCAGDRGRVLDEAKKALTTETSMKFEVTKDWCLEMAALEDGIDITIGVPETDMERWQAYLKGRDDEKAKYTELVKTVGIYLANPNLSTKHDMRNAYEDALNDGGGYG